MLLTGFAAENFRLLQDFALQFSDPVTTIIGPNNSGKSNVVDALLFLRDGLRGASMDGLLSARRGFARVVSGHDSKRIVTLRVALRSDDAEEIAYSVSFDKDGLHGEHASIGDWEYKSVGKDGSLEIRQLSASAAGQESSSTVYTDLRAIPLFRDNPQEAQPLRDYFQRMSHVDPFRAVGYMDQGFQYQVGANPIVDPSGVNLAQVLHYHYTNDREAFDAYEEIVRSVLPEVDIIETPISEGTSATVSIRFRDDPGKYDLWQLSSGVKDSLILLAAIHFWQSGGLLILEEPENHLHPASQKALCRVVKEIAERDYKQFVITTHSETILGQFEPETVVFVHKLEGRAHAEGLADADVYQVWQKLGIDESVLLQVLGRARQAIVIVEGRTDAQVLDVLWEFYAIRDKALSARAEGGGWEEVVDSAEALRDALERFRLPSTVFVILDNDGERAAKLAYLSSHGFDDSRCHVWTEKEIESYLLLPPPLSRISQMPIDDVERVIRETTTRGKEQLEDVLKRLGISGTPAHVIARNAIASNPEELPQELRGVAEKVRKLFGS